MPSGGNLPSEEPSPYAAAVSSVPPGRPGCYISPETTAANSFPVNDNVNSNNIHVTDGSPPPYPYPSNSTGTGTASVPEEQTCTSPSAASIEDREEFSDIISRACDGLCLPPCYHCVMTQAVHTEARRPPPATRTGYVTTANVTQLSQVILNRQETRGPAVAANQNG